MYNLNIIVLLCPLLTIILGNTSVKTSYCEFKEDIFSYSYNLTKVTKPGEDVVINWNFNENVRIQLCSPLVKKCNGKDGYSVCLQKDDKEIGIGKAIPKLETKSGSIYFIFTGDECKPGVHYIVNVTMKCDFSVTSYTTPTIFENVNNPCHLDLEWPTVFACGQRKEIKCSLVDPSDGSHYDLSPLKRYSENYVIYAGNNSSLKLILNVCHSVIFGHDALCHMSSGACLQDPKALPLGYVNLGDILKPLSLDSSKNLKLEYEDGHLCNGPHSKPHSKTVITFICNLEAKETLPEVTKTDGCNHDLRWVTAAACSLEKLRDYSAKTAGKCTINNPITNFTYNLQSLMNKDFSVMSSQGIKYNFRVCEAITEACKTGTGVCLKENGTSLGMANTNLMWQQAGPYLNYTDGDKCNTNQYHQTLINFLCGPNGASNDPVIVQEDPCQLVINWNHNLICEKNIKCVTANNEVDLTSLVRSSSNYAVKVNRTVFYMNICRPIISIPGLNCAHGSAVCKASLDSNDKLIEEINLGFPKEVPQVNQGQIILRYLEGSPCPEKKNIKISSIFSFLCSDKNESFPEFKEYKDCTYFFEWRTSIACGTFMGDWISPCTIKDRFLSNQLDLSLLHKKLKIYYVENKGKNYSISICEGQNSCNGSAICQGAINYGSLSNVFFNYNHNIIKLKYFNGSKCVNSSYMSEIKFVCDESTEIGEPTLLRESECKTEFEWRTNVTCLRRYNEESSKTNMEKQESVQSSSSHAGLVAGIVIAIIMFLLALLYYRNPSRRACLYSCFNFCNSRRGSGRVQYCRVGTTEQARLLLNANDPTQCQSDSDDDLLDA